MATLSSLLAWRIPWTVYSPWGGKQSETTEQLSLSTGQIHADSKLMGSNERYSNS